jgi:hypothetical protein
VRKVVARLVRVSPALVIAMLALFVALTGTAVATTSALITGKQIKNSSITGLDVKNKSLTPRDFKGSVRGPRGLTGPVGPAGPAGAPNPNAVNSDKLDNFDSADFVRKAEAFTGYFSCAGTAWQEAESTATYSLSGSDRFNTSTTGNQLFRCSLDVPHGATLTEVAFGVRDTDNTGNDVTCQLWRTNMATSVGTELNMASVGTTGAPGSVRISDTTISSPTIDNANFSYFMQCRNESGTTANAFFGANVTYTLTGAQGATAVVEGGHVTGRAGVSGG